MPIKGCNVQVWIIANQLQCNYCDVHNMRFPNYNSSFFRVSPYKLKTLQVMTETDPVSPMFETKSQDSVHGPEYLLLFNMITGNTFFINRFPNTITAIRITVQYTGYSWGNFNSYVLLIQCSPPTHPFPSSVYTIENFVNKCHNKERNVVNTWPLVRTG